MLSLGLSTCIFKQLTVMGKTRRLTAYFQEMRSGLNQASNKDGRPANYQRCRIFLNKTVKVMDGKVAVLYGLTAVDYRRDFSHLP